ncbi:MAG: carbohydrate ABC transporter permease [Treponema sp.]|jgi:multiple sugar transport system permease protein/putative aldouronate transport system permease protein|nr:carbohydrate ABC transporter permease [Treponema sp.]
MKGKRSNGAPKRVRLTGSDIIFYASAGIIIGFLFLITAYPIILVLSSSFSDRMAVLSGRVVLWPMGFSLEGYVAVFKYPEILLGYRNTIFYTATGTFVNIFVTMIAAYPLSRSGWYGKKVVSFAFIFTMFFSGGMIPVYLQIRNLGLLNSVWAMILPGAISIYNMIIARTFIQNTIPKELFESAKIDGSSEFRCFLSIVLPLSKAVIAVLVLYYAVGHWNAYFNAFIYLSKRELYPLQIFLREILIANSVEMNPFLDDEAMAYYQGMYDLLKYALIVVATAPIICVYPFIQKYFVKGVMIGSVKG